MPKPHPEADGRSRLSRRTLFAGAGTVGALGAAAALMPQVVSQAPSPAAPRPAPEKGGGYALTERVKQYYKTTLI
ncbi:MAG: hypothetical protein RLZZ352_2615 [Pseudomonadota bacterium]|jgi:hypothetical protein